MKRALIVASVGVASTVWVVSANAQANINPNVYRGNTSGPYGAQAPWEWHAGPGPMRRGNKCVEHVDLNRGYGFMKDCPAPQGAQAAQKRAPRRAAAR
jgi:hypothetical protein